MPEATPLRVLFVDDERDLVSSLTRYFRLKGFDTKGAYSVGEGVAALTAEHSAGRSFDAVVTDLRMPDGDGLAIVRAVRKTFPGCPVLVLTAFGTVATSVEAMRLGAVTMLEKPIPAGDLEREVRAAVADVGEVHAGLSAAVGAGLVGASSAIRDVFDTLVRVAGANSSVLITGESGTGKELVAQAVHRLSRRAMGPLVAVNCAAIPEQLLESELFGHVKGAFTGAQQSRPGRFKLADGGTIFLDEIGEMPLLLQGKLLRVLQERVIEPVGANKGEPVDFRVLAATNKDLEALVGEGKFRQDLFYRLNVVPLVLPPLRERTGDVPILVQHFLEKTSAKDLSFAPEAMKALERYSWPGNVRELQNLVERLAVLKGAGEIGLADLPGPIRAAASSGRVAQTLAAGRTIATAAPAGTRPGPPETAPEDRPGPAQAAPEDRANPAQAALDDRAIPAATLPPEGIDLYAALAELEDRLIREALERSGGNKNQAAKILRLNRTTLVEKLKKRAKADPPGSEAKDPSGSES